MASSEHILVLVAHPDDETFGCGSVIAHAAARGARVTIGAATLGELGEAAPGFDLGGRTLAEWRHDELVAAASILGADCLPPLGFTDSGWDGPAAPGSLCGAPWETLVATLTATIAQADPDIVLTVSGDDGHRDHRRLAEAVGAAFADAAPEGSSLYHWCLPNRLMRRWADETARLRPGTAHLAMADLGTGDDAITTVVDTSAQLDRRERAIAAHASQVSPYAGLSTDLARDFLTTDHLIRVVPALPPGRRESELTHGRRRAGLPAAAGGYGCP